jgi:hypothetical protein
MVELAGTRRERGAKLRGAICAGNIQTEGYIERCVFADDIDDLAYEELLRPASSGVGMVFYSCGSVQSRRKRANHEAELLQDYVE